MRNKTTFTAMYRVAAGALMPLIMAFLPGCAKVGAPTGGLKDVTPPKYIDGTPVNKAVNFNGSEIEFSFDEYIQLKDLNRELIVSPPLKEKPVVRLRDKSLRIDLNNDLYPATTYTLNFGTAISDLNEGNPLPDFEFVFSTGDHIDSLSVTGKALNALDHKPLKDAEILVGLYNELADSVPIRQIPRYLGKANKNGLFAINNIQQDTFRIIALNDANANLKYDPEMEWIAFLDSFLVLSPATVKPVTFIKDTLELRKDIKKSGRARATESSSPDTMVQQGRQLNALNISLYYFLEETKKVFLSARDREAPEKLQFIFNRSLHDSLIINPINYIPAHDWYILEESAGRDSIIFWITDTLMAGRDTLSFILQYTTTDSMNTFVSRRDTVKMRYQPSEKSGSGRRGRQKDVAEERNLAVIPGVANKGTVNLNKSLMFSTEKPLKDIDPDRMELIKTIDSLEIPQAFTCRRDSLHRRRFELSSVWEEESKYKLLLKPGAARDIYGRVNDTLQLVFSTQSTDYYGRILISASGKNFPVIIQVLDQKGRVADTGYLEQPGMITFEYLPPETYALKAVFDRNGNRKWDTGHYLNHLQPEQVFFYRPVELRSNWDYEVSWLISE